MIGIVTFGLVGCVALFAPDTPEGPNPQGELSPTFGLSLCTIHDVDGDLVDDFLTADPGYSGSDWKYRGQGERCSVFVISGKNGSLIHQLDSPEFDDGFGVALADAGDVNGDGVNDVLVGTNVLEPGKPGMAYLFSGHDGQQLRAFAGDGVGAGFGLSVDGGVDLDGDEVPEVFVGGLRSHDDDTTRVVLHVYAGADGQRLHAMEREVVGDCFLLGAGICCDVDRDGVSDIYFARTGPGATPDLLQVISGATFEVLQTRSEVGVRRVELIDGPLGGKRAGFAWRRNEKLELLSARGLYRYRSFSFPWREIGDKVNAGGIVRLPDQDGDGVAELVVGQDGWAISSGRVVLLSGRTGFRLRSFNGRSTWHFGWQLDTLSDVDADGFPDLLVGNDCTRSHDAGGVWVVSGKTGSHVYRLERPSGFLPVVIAPDQR